MREPIPYSYRCFTGQILTDDEVDRYNGIQEDINRWLKAGLAVPNWLLDWSHRYFSTISQ